jgi:(S)-2-hydroxyglutarate dehydrogenase
MRIAVIGGGVVGLASAAALINRIPDAKIELLEKENDICRHQSGRNSGVVHSGIYYKPNSFKAEFCRVGRIAIENFAEQHGVEYQRTGKLIVATDRREMAALNALFQRGQEHGLNVLKLTLDEARQFEPNVSCVGAVYVPETGIIDYVGIARVLAAQLNENGGRLLLGQRVASAVRTLKGWQVDTLTDSIEADYVVNCAGLHSDDLANVFGMSTHKTRIIPFRGEYFDLKPSAASLVRGLIYPVPDPELPFLGVHLTRMINGSVHAGPNAVLAMSKEGYKWTSINPREITRTISYPGFLRLARRNFDVGLYEVRRSFSKRLFVRDLQRLVPEIRQEDLVRSAAGVRAQAVDSTGALVDDFRIVPGDRSLHVVNAPSPAATCCLTIGKYIADEVLQLIRGTE